MRQHTPRRPRRGGFTLIEVLLVLVILVVLATFATIGVNNARKGALVNAAKSQIGGFETPLQSFNLDVGSFPNSLDELVMQPGDTDKWNGPYINKTEIPLDPWGEPYQYQYPGKFNPDGFDVWSLGPDRAEGTEDDIGNWTT